LSPTRSGWSSSIHSAAAKAAQIAFLAANPELLLARRHRLKCDEYPPRRSKGADLARRGARIRFRHDAQLLGCESPSLSQWHDLGICISARPLPLRDIIHSPLLVLLYAKLLSRVVSPTLAHTGTSNRYPGELERTPCGHLCGAAEEQGELSWTSMLIHQDTSPFGLCSRLRLRWRHG
jgi:hypothetical protein